jgi:hypothetical protein
MDTETKSSHPQGYPITVLSSRFHSGRQKNRCTQFCDELLWTKSNKFRQNLTQFILGLHLRFVCNLHNNSNVTSLKKFDPVAVQTVEVHKTSNQ